ncbi:MAG: GNAT family N-acetyltransferase, partial [Rhodospirillaceae bacterium]|nr:GNAT family N-acetyltransferase [Rhodospirillaceae bacterium]
MPDGSDTFQISVIPAIAEIDADDWDACAGNGNPFVSHAFLLGLEQSGAVKPETGWMAQHLTLRDGDARLLGVMALYLKGNSLGEYVFDHGWADAYERAGGTYYPK